MNTTITTNPITMLRGAMTQDDFAFAVNQHMGVRLVSAFTVSRLESGSYAHKPRLSTLIPFASYAGVDVGEFAAQYVEWRDNISHQEANL